jgi:hypothetical protein
MKNNEISTQTNVEALQVNKWWCESCATGHQMTFTEMVEHLRVAHGKETRGLKCQKKRLACVEGDSWTQETYVLTIANINGGVMLTNECISPR